MTAITVHIITINVDIKTHITKNVDDKSNINKQISHSRGVPYALCTSNLGNNPNNYTQNINTPIK